MPPLFKYQAPTGPFIFLNHPRSANDSQQISMNLWQLDWILDPKTIKTMSFNVGLEHLH